MHISKSKKKKKRNLEHKLSLVTESWWVARLRHSHMATFLLKGSWPVSSSSCKSKVKWVTCRYFCYRANINKKSLQCKKMSRTDTCHCRKTKWHLYPPLQKNGRSFTAFIQNYHVLSAQADVKGNQWFSKTLLLGTAIQPSDVGLVQITPEKLWTEAGGTCEGDPTEYLRCPDPSLYYEVPSNDSDRPERSSHHGENNPAAHRQCLPIPQEVCLSPTKLFLKN